MKNIKLTKEISTRGIKVVGLHLPDFNPETQATLGATLSRNPGSMESRLSSILHSADSQKRMMDVFFKKYGHNSIGDMGFFMFSIEGLSMKGAFNTIENRLFNGQEASTRYIDFGKMGFLPISEEVDKRSKECMDLYNKIRKSVIQDLMSSGVSEKEAEPQAFDIAGAFLPMSARTNVFWVGNIRTYITQIRKLMSGDEESREIGSAMAKVFHKICPNSMKDVGEDFCKSQIDFAKTIMGAKKSQGDAITNWKSFDTKSFTDLYKSNFQICDELNLYGSISASFPIDFRSARDIHRHRAFSVNTVVDYNPLGIEDFYLGAISNQGLKSDVIKIFDSLFFEELSDTENGEYGMPMATRFLYVMSGDLPAWLYFLKLRSGPKVHPTVISLAQKIGSEFENVLTLKDVYQRGSADYLKRSNDSNEV